MRFIGALLLTGCAGSLPVSGVWVVPAPELVDDGCNLYADEDPQAGGAELSEVGPTGFVLTLDDRGPTDCTLDGLAFACAPWQERTSFGVVAVEVDLGLVGRFRSPWRATGTLTAGVRCEGDACLLLPALGLDTECSSTLGWEAVHATR